jgi:hypothetical protein
MILIAGADARGQDSKVYALFLIDTDMNAYKEGEFDPDATQILRAAAKTDRKLMLRAFVESFNSDNRRHRLEYKVLDGEQATKQAVMDYYANLVSTNNDTLFFYANCHGAIDGNMGHYLSLTYSAPLYRSDLRGAMMYQKCRQIVIVTDCCSSYIDAERAREDIGPGANWEVVSDLMFRRSGMFDITAASPGTVAVAQRDIGGFFTESLVHCLCSPLSESDEDGDGSLRWAELSRRVTGRVINHHEVSQRPLVYYDSIWPNVLGERKLLVENKSAYSIDVYVRYLTKTTQGNWTWFGNQFKQDYSLEPNQTSWTLAPGQSTYLKDEYFRIRGREFIIYARARGYNWHWPTKRIKAIIPEFLGYVSDDGAYETYAQTFR